MKASFVAHPKDETTEEWQRKIENTKKVLLKEYGEHYGEWLLATTTQNAEMGGKELPTWRVHCPTEKRL